MGRRAVESAPAHALAELVRASRAEILLDWQRAARPLQQSKGLSGPALVDDMTAVLDDLAEELARGTGEEAAGARVVAEHTIQRLGQGFDPAQAVSEYAILRDAILGRWEAAAGEDGLAAARALDAAIDRVIERTVELHTTQRNRTLVALDRISAAGLEERPLSDLLGGLLDALLESCPAVDTAAFLLVEGDRLRVAAMRGLADCPPGFSLRIGEGFAGRVAGERRPIALRDASQDPLVTGPHLREGAIRALYGIPLLSGGALVGVVHAGSRRHEEFGADDRQLLRALADRAAASIRIHALRAHDERRAEELRARATQAETLAELGARALAGGPMDAVLAVAMEKIAAVLGADLAMVGELAGDVLRMRAGHGWREGTVGTAELPLGDSLAGLALRQHAPAVVEDVRAGGGARLAAVVLAHGGVSGAAVPLEHPDAPGALSVFSRAPRRYHPFDLQFLQAAGSLLAVAIARERGDERLRASEAAARRGEERLRFLSDAGGILARSLDVGHTAQRLTDLAVPRIADWCMLDLVSPEGLVEVAALSTCEPDPLRAERVRAYRAEHPLRADAPYGVATVLATGESLLLARVDEPLLRRIAPDERYVRWVLEARLHSILAVPLRGPRGAIGVLSFATTRDSGRVLGEEERLLAEGLAARASLALENASLHEETQRAVRLREDVLAIVSHDLKTPLHAIRLTAEVMERRHAADAAVVRSARTIRHAADRTNLLLRDLLDMASIQAGRLAVHVGPVEATEIVAAALELAQPAASERRVALVREGTGGRVLADRERVEQVLGNLLANAIRHSPSPGRVAVRLADAAEGLRFEVVDEGAGIAPADLPRIFDAYWSARTARGVPAAERGTGLGLFIAKGILDAHGARLEVSSRAGAGTTFGFTLKRA